MEPEVQPIESAEGSLGSLLAQREFRALLAARGTNALALGALTTIVAFQTYALTNDPLALGWLGLVEAIPALTLVLLGGDLADRRDRRTIVVVTSIVMAACAVTFAVVSALGGLTLPGILAIIFVAGIAAGFERPAQSALEAQVIPRDVATRGVSVLSSVSLGGAIAGPAAAGIGIAVLGIPVTYALVAALLAVSTVSVALIRRRPVPEAARTEPFRTSLLGGIRYVGRTPALLGSMALDLFAVFFGGAIALLPVFAADVLHVGSVGLGLLRTAPSVGALIVMLVATRRPPARHAGAILMACVTGFGVSMVVFGASTVFAVSLVALVFAGITDGVSVIIRFTILRVLSPERIRGRVASVNWVFIGASNELGAFESGVAASLFGAVPAVVGGGLLTIGIAVATAILVPSLRRLDLTTAEPDPHWADDPVPATST